MSWQQVAALALLIGGAITAAAFHSDMIAATLAGAAAGFAINRNGGRPESPVESKTPPSDRLPR